jgi:hypothetical protein
MTKTSVKKHSNGYVVTFEQNLCEITVLLSKKEMLELLKQLAAMQ